MVPEPDYDTLLEVMTTLEVNVIRNQYNRDRAKEKKEALALAKGERQQRELDRRYRKAKKFSPMVTRQEVSNRTVETLPHLNMRSNKDLNRRYVQENGLKCFKCKQGDSHKKVWPKTGHSKYGPWALCLSCHDPNYYVRQAKRDQELLAARNVPVVGSEVPL